MNNKKIIAYIMVFFLILNLFSRVGGSSFVQAAGEYGITAQIEILPREDDPNKNKLRVTYYVTEYTEGSDVHVERSVTRDGDVIGSDILAFSDASYSEEFTEDGDYKIEYRLSEDPEQPLFVMQLLDNESPTVDVTENEDDSVDITVTDDYLDGNCCHLKYSRLYLDGFNMQDTSGSLGISLL